jgi:hypothetical protein
MHISLRISNEKRLLESTFIISLGTGIHRYACDTPNP